MPPLVRELAGKVHDFAQLYRAYAYRELQRAQASGPASTPEQIDALTVRVDFGTLLVELSAVLMRPPAPPP